MPKKENPLDTTPKKSPLKNTPRNSPALTFTEAEVQAVADFVNFIYQNATFDNMTSKGAQQYSAWLANIHQHVKVCEAHIMELVGTSKAP